MEEAPLVASLHHNDQKIWDNSSSSSRSSNRSSQQMTFPHKVSPSSKWDCKKKHCREPKGKTQKIMMEKERARRKSILYLWAGDSIHDSFMVVQWNRSWAKKPSSSAWSQILPLWNPVAIIAAMIISFGTGFSSTLSRSALLQLHCLDCLVSVVVWLCICSAWGKKIFSLSCCFVRG